MSPAVRPLVRMALLLVALSVALVGYRSATSPRVPPHDLVARLWTVGFEDSEASVERKLGKPVRSTEVGFHERILRFESGGEGAEIIVGPEGVVATRAIPSLLRPNDQYPIVGGVPSNPSN